MGDKSGVSRIGDCIRDEAVVEFLCVVDFQTAGHAGAVEVADPINVVAQRARYVPIRDLNMVNVEQDLHAW